MDKMLLNVDEAAQVLGIGTSKLFELLAQRRLRSVKIDGCRRIPVAALVEFVEKLSAADDLIA